MLEAAGMTHQGSVRKNNEDYYLIAPELGLYVVADGMGGARAGEHASRLAAQTVADFLRHSERKDAQALQSAVEEANRVVKAAAAQDPSLDGMGTTLVAALENEDRLLIVSVGDSRAYVFEDDVLHLITDDQTWIHEVGRPLGIAEADLRNHPMRHVLTMAIGANTPLKTHQYDVPLRPGTQVLLSSDGLHGVVPAEIIAEALNSERSLDAQCHYLVDAAVRAGGPDNITAVLLRAS